MQSYLIVGLSVVAASAATPIYFSPELSALSDFSHVVGAQWPSLAVAWLSFYGAAALILTSVTSSNGSGQINRFSASEWARDFFRRLLITQYFSCMVLLLAIALAPFPLQVQSLYSGLVPAEGVLRFLPSAALLLAGLVVWLIAATTVLLRIPPIGQAEAEMSTLPEANLRLPGYGPSNSTEFAHLAELIEQQRTMLEETRDTAIAIYHLGEAIHGEVESLKGRPQAVCDARSAIDRMTANLRDTLTMLHEKNSHLGEAGMLPKTVPPGAAPLPGILPGAIPRSELSRELEKLLEQMPPPRRDPSG